MQISDILKPSLNPVWSQRVLDGAHHKNIVSDAAAVFQRPGASNTARALAVADTVGPLVRRTGQYVIIVADLMVSPIVNVAASAFGPALGASVWSAREITRTVQHLRGSPFDERRWPDPSAASRLGSSFVHKVYACAVELSILVCACMGALANLPARLAHYLTSKPIDISGPRASEFSALRTDQVEGFFQGLEGQGGPLASIRNIVVRSRPAPSRHTSVSQSENLFDSVRHFFAGVQNASATGAHSFDFSGEVRALFGLVPTATFNGHVTCENGEATRINLHVPGRSGLNPIDLDFRPTMHQGRLHMSGHAQGFHFAKHKPITSDLTALGYTEQLGRWASAQEKQFHGCDPEYGGEGEFIRFSRGGDRRRTYDGWVGDSVQEITYNGGWRDGFSMGRVELKQFPFAVATKLGMLLYLDS